MPTSLRDAEPEKPTLGTIISSPEYPLPAGSAPDLLTRRLAELVPEFLVELDTPDTTDSVDINLVMMRTPDDMRAVSINLDAPDEEGYRPFDEWRVFGEGDGRVVVTLSLPHDADQAELDFVIRLLQMLQVVPKVQQ
jgi:hypothetical protein